MGDPFNLRDLRSALLTPQYFLHNSSPIALSAAECWTAAPGAEPRLEGLPFIRQRVIFHPQCGVGYHKSFRTEGVLRVANVRLYWLAGTVKCQRFSFTDILVA